MLWHRTMDVINVASSGKLQLARLALDMPDAARQPYVLW